MAEDLDAEMRLALTVDTWNWVHRACAEVELLAVAEDGGLGAVRAWLTARGLRWVECRGIRIPAVAIERHSDS